MPSQPDMIEALLRSQLLADMSPEQRRDLSLRFEVRPFSAGQTLIADGAEGRALLEILAGTANVYVKEDEHRYRVAQLEPGSIAGETGFFSGQTRSADVIGSSEGIVAVLPWPAYVALTHQDSSAAEALEKAILCHLNNRVLETNARLQALLTAREKGGLKSVVQSLLGMRESAPVVDHG